MTRNDLRTHYKTVKDMIEKERRTREAVLGHSPKLGQKLAECDAALASLVALGQWIRDLLPEDGEPQPPTQPALLVPPTKRPYS